MADRQAAGARSPKPARRRNNPRRRSSAEALLRDLGASRPPCSVAERETAQIVARRLRATGLRPVLETARAPTSPTWAPLMRTLCRVWAAAFLAAGWHEATIGLASAAVLGGIPPVAGAIRFIPLLGARSRNVVARRRGTDRGARPVVVVAHLDTHMTAGAPMHRAHGFLAAASGWVVLAAAVAGRTGTSTWRLVAALVAFECVVTLLWLARRELAMPKHTPDDNTSGLLALLRTADLLAEDHPRSDVWLVGTGAGTSGSYGMTSFLRSHAELRGAWVVEIDALGAGEVVASPLSARFPYPGTPQALIRAVASAAQLSEDPLTIRRVPRPHSDARAALRKRTAAIVLTEGLRSVGPGTGPDPANAERAARVVSRLASLPD